MSKEQIEKLNHAIGLVRQRVAELGESIKTELAKKDKDEVKINILKSEMDALMGQLGIALNDDVAGTPNPQQPASDEVVEEDGFFTRSWHYVKNKVTGAYDWTKDQISDAYDWVMDNKWTSAAAAALVAAGVYIYTSGQTTVSGITKAFNELGEVVGDAVGDQPNVVVKVVGDTINFVVSNVKAGWTWIVHLFQTTPVNVEQAEVGFA
jgi:hypothetical protein